MRIAIYFHHFVKTISFFTIIPLPTHEDTDAGLEYMAFWTPWAGLVIGIGIIMIQYLAAWLFPPAIIAACVLFGWVFLTGGLHLDGLADCYDAFCTPVEKVRRKEIMRDPHLGTFAVIGILLTLLLKYCTIYVILTSPKPPLVISQIPFPLVLLFAPVAARWLVLWVARLPASQPAGLGATFAQGVTLQQILAAGILPFILTVIGGLTAVIAVLIAGLGTYAITRIARTKIGGVNGDVLGASIEVSELLILCVYSSNIVRYL